MAGQWRRSNMPQFYSTYEWSRPTSVVDAIWQQSINLSEDNFLCKTCKRYLGGCSCLLGVFIAFEGANLSRCYGYQKGTKCIHCGKIT
jgi:hypothetical protein